MSRSLRVVESSAERRVRPYIKRFMHQTKRYETQARIKEQATQKNTACHLVAYLTYSSCFLIGIFFDGEDNRLRTEDLDDCENLEAALDFRGRLLFGFDGATCFVSVSLCRNLLCLLGGTRPSWTKADAIKHSARRNTFKSKKNRETFIFTYAYSKFSLANNSRFNVKQ